MPVYVDDMYQHPMGEFRGMKMSHMIADTTAELLAVADKIGVARKWIQHAGTPGEHFDIALTKRQAAVKAGAVEITLKQCSFMTMRRRETGMLGTPEHAEDWHNARKKNILITGRMAVEVIEQADRQDAHDAKF